MPSPIAHTVAAWLIARGFSRWVARGRPGAREGIVPGQQGGKSFTKSGARAPRLQRGCGLDRSASPWADSATAIRSVDAGFNRLPGTLGFGYALLVTLTPDFDSFAGLWFRDFGSYHNNATHSLFAGLLVATAGAAGMAAVIRAGPGFARRFAGWFALGLAAYGLHLLMDVFTIGRGVRLLWPFSDHRFASPIPIFYGLNWAEPLLSAKHFLTLANEGLMIAGAALLARYWRQRFAAPD